MAISAQPRFQVYQRENKTFLLVYTSPDQVDDDSTSATYNPLGLVDLTGHTLYYRWKKQLGINEPDIIAKSSDAATEILKKTQTALPWTTDSTLGEAEVFLVPDDTDPAVNTDLGDLSLEEQVGTFYFDSWVVLSGSGEQKIAARPSPIDLLEAVTVL